jgi:hypothetical protein
MKKLFFLAVFFSLSAMISVQAQCSHAKKAAETEKVTCTKTAAAEAASLDASVEKRVCPTSGKVSYVRKNVCSTSGKVSYADVEYCTKSGKFINVSPSAKEKAASCSKSAGAAKATSVSAEGKSGCCSKKAAAASCGSKANASAAASCGSKSKASAAAGCCSKKASSGAVKAKLTKNEEGTK